MSCEMHTIFQRSEIPVDVKQYVQRGSVAVAGPVEIICRGAHHEEPSAIHGMPSVVFESRSDSIAPSFPRNRARESRPKSWAHRFAPRAALRFKPYDIIP